jgi:starch synthase (maltosyl-transferring)
LLGANARDVTPGHGNGAARRPGRIELAPRSLRVFTGDGTRAKPSLPPAEAAQRARAVVIERVRPQLDGGHHPIKRIVGERITVSADVFRDGHDAIDAVLLYRERGATAWREAPLEFVENDEWEGSFEVTRNARYEYTIEAWPDHFGTWRHDTQKKQIAKQALGLEMREGRALIDGARSRATGEIRERLAALLAELDAVRGDDARATLMLAGETGALVARAPDRAVATRYAPALPVIVDRRAAQFAAWYEFFPRSQGTVPGVHGTFADAAARLPQIRALGFDVVYLPPIHRQRDGRPYGRRAGARHARRFRPVRSRGSSE